MRTTHPKSPPISPFREGDEILYINKQPPAPKPPSGEPASRQTTKAIGIGGLIAIPVALALGFRSCGKDDGEYKAPPVQPQRPEVVAPRPVVEPPTLVLPPRPATIPEKQPQEMRREVAAPPSDTPAALPPSQPRITPQTPPPPKEVVPDKVRTIPQQTTPPRTEETQTNSDATPRSTPNVSSTSADAQGLTPRKAAAPAKSAQPETKPPVTKKIESPPPPKEQVTSPSTLPAKEQISTPKEKPTSALAKKEELPPPIILPAEKPEPPSYSSQSAHETPKPRRDPPTQPSTDVALPPKLQAWLSFVQRSRLPRVVDTHADGLATLVEENKRDLSRVVQIEPARGGKGFINALVITRFPSSLSKRDVMNRTLLLASEQRLLGVHRVYDDSVFPVTRIVIEFTYNFIPAGTIQTVRELVLMD
jgi:hypothetical protein